MVFSFLFFLVEFLFIYLFTYYIPCILSFAVFSQVCVILSDPYTMMPVIERVHDKCDLFFSL